VHQVGNKYIDVSIWRRHP